MNFRRAIISCLIMLGSSGCLSPSNRSYADPLFDALSRRKHTGTVFSVGSDVKLVDSQVFAGPRVMQEVKFVMDWYMSDDEVKHWEPECRTIAQQTFCKLPSAVLCHDNACGSFEPERDMSTDAVEYRRTRLVPNELKNPRVIAMFNVDGTNAEMLPFIRTLATDDDLFFNERRLHINCAFGRIPNSGTCSIWADDNAL